MCIVRTIDHVFETCLEEVAECEGSTVNVNFNISQQPAIQKLSCYSHQLLDIHSLLIDLHVTVLSVFPPVSACGFVYVAC